MRYEPPLFRPPSEARSYILQATIGCSWNNCTYCQMYRSKPFRVRPLEETLADLRMAAEAYGPRVEKLFVADGDALVLPMDHWEPILLEASRRFPRLRQVSCYAMASNILAKTPAELRRLRQLGLSLFYIGPESGDEVTMRRLAKQPKPEGASREEDYLFDMHVAASERAKAADIGISAIFLLGAGGVERSAEHAAGSAALATAMQPDYLAALTLTVVEGTPLARTKDRLGWALPDQLGLLRELRTFVNQARPGGALFRTNHASNYLPLGGRLPQDRARIVELIDLALEGRIPLRPESARGL
ncbi:MAG: radical SAM protein [Alphaproteobacteria bacterium]|nr:radical SAM protein [Alphaproteobacteria bacterium]MCB9795648.1 radical SAM protein [Alphaproteobacteria bacterium]